MRLCLRCAAAVEPSATRCPACGYTRFADGSGEAVATTSPPAATTPAVAAVRRDDRGLWLAAVCLLAPPLGELGARLILLLQPSDAHGATATALAALTVALAALWAAGRWPCWLVAVGLAARWAWLSARRTRTGGSPAPPTSP